jgi:hypothetical protein
MTRLFSSHTAASEPLVPRNLRPFRFGWVALAGHLHPRTVRRAPARHIEAHAPAGSDHPTTDLNYRFSNGMRHFLYSKPPTAVSCELAQVNTRRRTIGRKGGRFGSPFLFRSTSVRSRTVAEASQKCSGKRAICDGSRRFWPKGQDKPSQRTVANQLPGRTVAGSVAEPLQRTSAGNGATTAPGSEMAQVMAQEWRNPLGVVAAIGEAGFSPPVRARPHPKGARA